jgi:hypothetical protein
MDLLHITGKKRSDTGSIMRLFAEDMQQIGGVDVRHRFNQGFRNYDFIPNRLNSEDFALIIGTEVPYVQ